MCPFVQNRTRKPHDHSESDGGASYAIELERFDGPDSGPEPKRCPATPPFGDLRAPAGPRRSTGVIYLDQGEVDAFTQGRSRCGNAVAAQAAIALEYVQALEAPDPRSPGSRRLLEIPPRSRVENLLQRPESLKLGGPIRSPPYSSRISADSPGSPPCWIPRR